MPSSPVPQLTPGARLWHPATWLDCSSSPAARVGGHRGPEICPLIPSCPPLLPGPLHPLLLRLFVPKLTDSVSSRGRQWAILMAATGQFFLAIDTGAGWALSRVRRADPARRARSPRPMTSAGEMTASGQPCRGRRCRRSQRRGLPTGLGEPSRLTTFPPRLLLLEESLDRGPPPVPP